MTTVQKLQKMVEGAVPPFCYANHREYTRRIECTEDNCLYTFTVTFRELLVTKVGFRFTIDRVSIFDEKMLDRHIKLFVDARIKELLSHGYSFADTNPSNSLTTLLTKDKTSL